mmetsp:Transcript_14873/g.23617  ORF Transcript_14873/g.23617 Transcript_14873/m.23617 type:complete len:346 (+) Transcript_14873:2291-3328(+)
MTVDLAHVLQAKLPHLCAEFLGLALLHFKLVSDNQLDEAELVGEQSTISGHLGQHVCLSLLVKFKAHRSELCDDILRRFVLLDLAIGIEEDHVTGADAGLQMENLLEAAPLRLCELVGRHVQNEVHGILRVVLPELRHCSSLLRTRLWQLIHEPVFVVLSPPLDWQLCNLEADASTLGCHADRFEPPGRSLDRSHRALEATVPRSHALHRLLAKETADICDKISRIVVGNRGAPTCTDTVSPIHQDSGDDRAVPARLNRVALLCQVLQDCVVLFREEAPSNLGEAREDVTGGGVVLAPLEAGAELAARLEEVDVVSANESLCHGDDGALQRNFSVMIGTVLGDVA